MLLPTDACHRQLDCVKVQVRWATHPCSTYPALLARSCMPHKLQFDVRLVHTAQHMTLLALVLRCSDPPTSATGSCDWGTSRKVCRRPHAWMPLQIRGCRVCTTCVMWVCAMCYLTLIDSSNLGVKGGGSTLTLTVGTHHMHYKITTSSTWPLLADEGGILQWLSAGTRHVVARSVHGVVWPEL